MTLPFLLDPRWNVKDGTKLNVHASVRNASDRIINKTYKYVTFLILSNDMNKSGAG